MENEVNEEVVAVANDTTENQEIDYKAKFEEADKEKNRLNSLIQKHKDKKPAIKADTTSEVPTFGKEDVEKMLNDNKFYLENPWMAEHKEAIEKFTLMWNSLEDAALLVRAKDSTIQARENTSNSNFTDWMSWGGKKSYTQEALQLMPHDDKMQALRDISAWKAIETL